MTIELLNNEDKPKEIWPGDMKDGDVGVIVAWSGDHYIGRIVHRYGDRLILIGMEWDQCWYAKGVTHDCRVRLLEKGEKLIVT